MAIYFKSYPIPQNTKIIERIERTEVVLNITDRENGICADMYAQGYKWGYAQHPLQISIWRLEEKSESQIKELLYDWLK